MRVLRLATVSITTSPPRPPSPPSGPPNSMNFSRRKPTQPFPPLPERMKTLAWSRNFMGVLENEKGERRPFPLRNPVGWERLFGGHCRRRDHVHLDLAARAGPE